MKLKQKTILSMHSPENDKPAETTECYPFSTLLLQSEKVLFAEDCNRYITSYRSIAQTALVAIQVARLKSNGIWTTGGFAQTVLVAMPTVCPPLQICAAAELATCIFSQRSFRHGRTLRLGRAL